MAFTADQSLHGELEHGPLERLYTARGDAV